jgi:hypothetical protein
VLGRTTPTLMPLATTAAFGAVCLAAAVVIFNRKSF